MYVTNIFYLLWYIRSLRVSVSKKLNIAPVLIIIVTSMSCYNVLLVELVCGYTQMLDRLYLGIGFYGILIKV